jgi:hypothetical protein
VAVIAGPGPVHVTSGRRRAVAATAALDADGVLHVAHGSSPVQRIDLWCVDAIAQHDDGGGGVVVVVSDRGTTTSLRFAFSDEPLAQRVLEVLADIAGPPDE